MAWTARAHFSIISDFIPNQCLQWQTVSPIHLELRISRSIKPPQHFGGPQNPTTQYRIGMVAPVAARGQGNFPLSLRSQQIIPYSRISPRFGAQFGRSRFTRGGALAPLDFKSSNLADREGLTTLRSVHAECARLLRRPQRAKVASAPGAFEFRCAQ